MTIAVDMGRKATKTNKQKPFEIIKTCSIVSFDKIYNEYLGFRYNIPKQQLTDYFKTASSLLIS